MVREDIELLDKEYFRIPLVRPSRKIKFKRLSFKNILSRWNKFRINNLKRRLAAKKENLVEMEFNSNQLVPGKNLERTEKKVLRKTQAIARLESIINFLENGQYHSEEFEDSRAIKLKSLMMQNLVHNRDSIYCVEEKAAEVIMSDSYNTVIDDTQEKISERVREILAEKEAAKKAAIEKSAINGNGTVEEKVTNDVIPVVSSDEVAAAIDTEMNKIKVEGPHDPNARVNKFINDDGTYRLKREDIDEDFRITRFDRSKLQLDETIPNELTEEPNIPPFNTVVEVRKKPDVEPPRKAITAIIEPPKREFPKIILPTIKNPTTDEQQTDADRVIPVVVPERENNPTNSPNNISVEEATEEGEFNLGALMAKVSLLRAEQSTIAGMAEEAEKEASSVDAAYREMLRRFADYAASLEADCNTSYQSMNEVKKESATKEAQITAMIQMMENAGASEDVVKGRARM